VQHIDPFLPPEGPWSPEKLRATFSALRTQYSIFNDRYHRSGHLEAGDGDGDDDFFINFVRGDSTMFYIHLIFKGEPPRFCLRDLEVSNQNDIGVTDNASSISSNSKTPKKRFLRNELSTNDLKELLDSTDTEKETLAAMSNYYTSLDANEVRRGLQETIEGPDFQFLPPELQEELKQQYTAVVKKQLSTFFFCGE
jgi:hypothetical protein